VAQGENPKFKPQYHKKKKKKRKEFLFSSWFWRLGGSHLARALVSSCGSGEWPMWKNT
jgi:hypothetical protein